MTPAEGSGVADAPRAWTSTDGKVIRGVLLGTEGDAATIRLESTGKRVTVPLSRLSADDRAFVAEHGLPILPAWAGWPDDIRMELHRTGLREQPGENGGVVYITEHFEIHRAEPLGQKVAQDVARQFECTYRLLAASPWGILATAPKGRFRAELLKNMEDYRSAGGPPHSAGVYLTGRRVFLVPFDTLGLRNTPRGWQRDEAYDTSTLVHELTHMLMHDALTALPMWVIEGTAVYMQLMPMRVGAFSPRGHFPNLKEYNEERSFADLGEVFRITIEAWQQGGEITPFGTRMGANPAKVATYYHSGLLLTYYFLHLDGDGDGARFQRFIAACHRNAAKVEKYHQDFAAYETSMEEFFRKPGVEDLGGGRFRHPETMKPPAAPVFPFEGDMDTLPFREVGILLDGRTEEQLLKEVRASLRKVGLRV